MSNTPADMPTAEILALTENDVRLLGASQFEDWHIDIGEEGQMIGRCPRCDSKDINAVTPEHMHCNGCGHTDGQQYRRIDCGPFEPGETVPVNSALDDER